MYIEKHEINGETYVKLDELNDLIKAKHREIVQRMKRIHAEGEDNTEWTATPPTLTELKRQINMSKNGEKYIIFRRGESDEWEYFMQLVKWDDIPAFVRKHLQKRDGNCVSLMYTNDLDDATLYDCYEDAQDALAAIEAERILHAGKWLITKRWMFDTKENRDSLLRLYNYGEEDEKKHDEKAAAIAQAENAIERTRTALDRTEKLLSKVKDGESEKPSETPQKPPMRTVMNKKGAKRCPARYTVWYRDDSDVTTHCMGFVRFEDGIPVFTNRPCKACWFVWRGMAETVAQKCGDGFEVVDMIGQMTAEERLLRAIFREDGMDGDEEPEYHGDGTRAEDEDWDGDE